MIDSRIAARVGVPSLVVVGLVGGAFVVGERSTRSVELSRATDAPDPCAGVAEHIHRREVDLACLPVRLPQPAAFVVTTVVDNEHRERSDIRVAVFDDAGLHPIAPERIVQRLSGRAGCEDEWYPMAVDLDGDGVDEVVITSSRYHDHTWTVLAVRDGHLVASPAHSFEPLNWALYRDLLVRRVYAHDALHVIP